MDTAKEVVQKITTACSKSLSKQLEDRVGGHQHSMVLVVSEAVGGLCISSELDRLAQLKFLEMAARSLKAHIVAGGLDTLLEILRELSDDDDDEDKPEKLH